MEYNEDDIIALDLKTQTNEFIQGHFPHLIKESIHDVIHPTRNTVAIFTYGKHLEFEELSNICTTGYWKINPDKNFEDCLVYHCIIRKGKRRGRIYHGKVLDISLGDGCHDRYVVKFEATNWKHITLNTWVTFSGAGNGSATKQFIAKH
jgi:hypothetical protein